MKQIIGFLNTLGKLDTYVPYSAIEGWNDNFSKAKITIKLMWILFNAICFIFCQAVVSHINFVFDELSLYYSK